MPIIWGHTPLFEATGRVLVGALMITYTILGVPYYSYRIMGPKTLF